MLIWKDDVGGISTPFGFWKSDKEDDPTRYRYYVQLNNGHTVMVCESSNGPRAYWSPKTVIGDDDSLDMVGDCCNLCDDIAEDYKVEHQDILDAINASNDIRAYLGDKPMCEFFLSDNVNEGFWMEDPEEPGTYIDNPVAKGRYIAKKMISLLEEKGSQEAKDTIELTKKNFKNLYGEEL